MRELQGKKSHRFFKSNIFAVILTVILLMALRNVWDVYKKNDMARINKEEAETRLSELETKKNNLEFEISRLGSDRGVEEELRERFQVTKPGEQVLVIVDKNTEMKTPAEVPQTILQKIWTGLLALLEIN